MTALASPAQQPPRALATAARRSASAQPRRHAAHALSREVALRAVRSLYHELALYPKPGLVSLVDNGSHTDMDAATFMRSLFSLRHYYARICRAGYDGVPFIELKKLGIAAEQRMMAATKGINTHRGAIFALGLLCAAMGRVRALRMTLTPAALRTALLLHWGEELAAHTHAIGDSHGRQAATRHAASGAREEGALGLPSVFDVGLPALQTALARGAPMLNARVEAIFALMSHISDTNIYHRGGAQGADTVRHAARHFLQQGGTANPQWKEHALTCHQRFIAQRLSPGGAADLLAATCLVHSLTAMPPP
ncbi:MULTISPECIES: triphosphoribosyl-dephospho-CoA synthase MdcB [unclassified Duganella]|uniref:triphosphoribosyl-dephospho-CoA synthase MdcB n=1 Tax=unclassified Duganella TaxID=2636909 RepID=UPI0009EB1838|nr:MULTISPECIES: triphosphoribosyl-dephospho-CoA synthase MdcB [unclassified Duganella]